MTRPGHLSATARLLGFGGLLPQLAALLLVVTRADPALGALMAFAYAAMILSFIGGIWWGIALQHAEEQGGYAAVAVLPTLVAFLLVLARVLGMDACWGLVAIGSALILTLLVDRRLTASGSTPAGWMQLRIPLSLGLGALTILAGALFPDTISIAYSG